MEDYCLDSGCKVTKIIIKSRVKQVHFERAPSGGVIFFEYICDINFIIV